MCDTLSDRNNMEDAILHSEEHYRAIISQAVVGIGHADLNGIIMFVNARFCEIVGYTREELLGFSMLKITHQEDLARNVKLVEQLVREGVPFQIEKRYVRRDGSPVWVSASVSLIRDAEGNPQSCVAVMTDITEHKRAEEAASLQSLLINLSYEPIFVWDIRKGIIEWNKGCEQFYGYSKAEAIGQTSHKLLQTLRPTSLDEFLRIIETDGEWTGELRHTTKDGREVMVESRQQLIETNGRRLILETNRDITERKRMEKALRESEERFRALIDKGVDVITISDHEGNITYASPSIEEKSGYTVEEFVRQNPFRGTIHPDDLLMCEATLKNLIGSPGASVFLQHRYLHKSGEWRWLEGTFTSLFHDPAVGGLVANFRDITERKRAEEELNANEERLRAIFEASRDGILVEDDERIVYVNQSYTHMFGYETPEELIGKHVSAVISPEDAERLVEFSRSRLRGEQPPSEYEFKAKRKNGTSVDVEASVSTSNVAGRTFITTMLRDITERKRAEERLRESETRFRAAFEQANVGVVQASSDGRLLVVNPGFCKIVGYPEEEARGMMIRDITHKDDYEKEEKLTRQLVAGEISGYSLEKRFLHKGGGIVWGNMTATLVRRASGEPYYLLSIVEDITERKRAEEELVKINEQLEGRVAERTVELMEMNSNLQAEITERHRVEGERRELLRRLVAAQEDERRRIAREMHDQFGQQLPALMLKLSTLKKDCSEQPKLREQIELAEAITTQLDDDVDFLVWQLRPTALDDLGLLAAVTNYSQNWSKHFGVPIELQASGMKDDRLTSEIETVLYRVAQEALNNIAKHAQASSVDIVLERRADHVLLIIEDDGVGFDTVNISSAGDRGLGLAGMRERAALVGGKVVIETQPGEGTTIIVRIPAPAP